MINVYYIFNDSDNSWLGDDGRFYEDLSMAKEFHSEDDAVKASKDNKYMVLGWVQ